jgi:hypothetical protein
MYEYILCEFEYGYSGRFYQEILNGIVIRYADLDGNTIELQGSYGSYVIDVNPPRPSWAQ